MSEQIRGRHLRSIAGREIYFDADGFLWDPKDWDDAVAEALASESGIPLLGEDHWRAIRFLRAHYAHHGRAPMNRELREGTGMSLLELERLCPAGIKLGLRRIAGIPNPKACLD